MKTILLFALSVIILFQSYGFAYGAEDIVTVATDSSSYETGEMIKISGSISDYRESDSTMQSDITLTVLNPKNSYIEVAQHPLNSDGSYSVNVSAGGPSWKFEGDYTITVCNGEGRCASTTFTFIFSEHEEIIEEIIEVSEEELAEQCGTGTHLEDDVCVLDETTVPTSDSTGFSPTTGSNELAFSITFTVFIAFAIMIILYLISRASRTKDAKLSD